MPKHLIKKYAPDHEFIRNHPHLQVFARHLTDPNLWHMNRRSVSGAFAAGLFWAMIPMPLQMLAAAATAIFCRVNLPISVALVWLTNPLTMPPIFYFTYLVGTWILGTPPSNGEAELSMQWLMDSLDQIWQPLFLGSFVCGLVLAAIGYAGMRGFWRWHIVTRIHERRAARRLKSTPTSRP